LAGSSIDYNINKVDIGNVGGVAAFQLMTESGWKFVNVGVNFSNQSIENYIETPGNSNIVIQKVLLTNNNPVTGNLTYLGHAYNRYGTKSKMNIGVGANYENYLYFGAGLNFIMQMLSNGILQHLVWIWIIQCLIIINNILLILRNQTVFQLH
jgi:methanogenic corrinoid protein MtbC1